ncbi:MAG: hypothetical protein ACFB20_01135 [Opitutales bacterium]
MNALYARSVQYILIGLVLWAFCALLAVQGLNAPENDYGQTFSYFAIGDGLIALFFTGWGLKLAVQGK